ncbi:MAG: translation elongation factor 4, partial [Clostridia bacterium]|nr:translation elongation factor 4 [Clostridia bacterium]
MSNTEKQKHIRNFSIIAHIDHGKSTLADRILEATETVSKREMEDQLLDSMELERERGITIKATAVRLTHTAEDGEVYEFNLIDTPGHVDFNYEVSRSLNACDGALLVVDATQGIEAQTLANAYLAVDANLEIVPVINKIDLPSADPDRCRAEIEDIIGIPAEGCPAVSAKTGLNIEDVLKAVVEQIPAPVGDADAPLKALIFDSYYDSYLGVVVNIRIFDGQVRSGDRIRLMSNGATFDVVDVGYMTPFGLQKCDLLSAGDVGYLTASIKSVGDTQVGDTVTLDAQPTAEALPGFQEVRPMVYAGIYPADGARYGDLRDALEKLQLNDAALVYEPETSIALGFGFRCGFLGLLHMEIIEERLEREFNLDLITTAPSVIYRIKRKDGETVMIDNPSNFPPADEIDVAYEPIVRANIITPTDYVGGLMDLCQDRRGNFLDMKYLDTSRVELHYDLPLNEIIYDFFDAMKSRSRGYASLDYELGDYVPSKLVKLDFLLNSEQVDALSFIVHEEKAYGRARRIAEKLKEN